MNLFFKYIIRILSTTKYIHFFYKSMIYIMCFHYNILYTCLVELITKLFLKLEILHNSKLSTIYN